MSKDGSILLGERKNESGQWQLPQGGIEDSESPVEALYREMQEEVGVSDFKILKESKDYISYVWPPEVFQSKKYIGQKHIYFLIDGSEIQLELLVATEEFARFSWYSLHDAIETIIDWKRLVCIQAFQILGLIN